MAGFVKLTSRQIENKLDFIKDYTHAENPASGSKLDANANVTVKNLTSLACELNKDINIQVNRKILYNKISKLFDTDLADEYIRQLEEHEIYAHDETSLAPYCSAISMYPFITDGMKSLGGESAAPKHLHSFCGSFVNLIYAISCQFAGACLHGSQKILVTENGKTKSISMKELVSRFKLDHSFESDGSEWEYADVSGLGLFVAEDGKNVAINKVYRRKYDGDIYNITTKTGLSVKCSKDHKFKHLRKEEVLESRAEDLNIGDTLSVNVDYTYLDFCEFDPNLENVDKSIKADVIASIEKEANDDKYVYELETETHWYNAGGFITHNCATVEFLMYFDWFARKDYGDNYLKTNKKEITDLLQQVIYCLNQPAGARNYQSTFWNISLFDKNYFDSLFGTFYFPDGTQPSWKSLQKLQNFFMKWFNEERTKALLTFPVVTAAMLVNDEKPVDEQFARDRAQDLAEGNSFFIYESNSVDSLSSCCFSGDTKFLWKSSVAGVKCTSFKDFFEMKYSGNKDNFKVFHNGSWVDGKVIKLPNRKMFRVVTENNKELVMTDNHINVTLSGEKQTSELTTSDYLMFNTETLHAIPELDENLTYEQGFVVGAFLGDGSFGSEIKGTIHETNFSQNAEKYPLLSKMLDICAEQMGIETRHKLSAVYNNVYPVIISSKELVAFIQRWTCWYRGTYSHNKKLNLNVLTQSEDFRRGILDGWYNTDGGNRNRCYTTSKELAESMEILITSLGMQSIINVSDRTNEPCVIRETEYTRNYPLYCVRWYQKANHRSNKSVKKSWVRKNNSLYFRIKSIEEVPYNGDVYCVECANTEEPYFTLPCGVITHNCRLRNELSDNDFSYSLGAGGVKSGSINVITINFNRLVQNVSKSYMIEKEINKDTMLKEHMAELTERIYKAIQIQVEKIQKYQVSYRSIMESYKAHRMLPVYDAGFIDLDKQFLTTGINGLVEGCEYLGLEISDNEKYKNFVSGALKVIYDTDKAGKAKFGYKFNCEMVPAENLGIKFVKFDRESGYEVPRDCYNSYFYRVEDETLNEIDKFRMHGGDMIKYLDGGSALHLNLKDYPDAEQYYKMMCIAAKEGCNYWTTNVAITICESCGHIDKHTLDKCPSCGSTSISYATRIIGYLKKISSFSKGRQIEAAKRFYH